MTRLTNEQQLALFALADSIRQCAEAFGAPAEAQAERLAIQTEAPPITADALRDLLNSLSKEHGRPKVAAVVAGRKINSMGELELAAMFAEIKDAFK